MPTTNAHKQDRFTFRKHASIGSAAAEEDAKFLSQSFVDTGDLGPLVDCSDRRRIILGRTGAGKSALLNKLVEQTNATVISPESLAFNFLTNSTVLQFFLEAGVKLDLFFKLLWRHVFTIELLKARYDLRSRSDARSYLERFKDMVLHDPHKDRAIKYLLQWGDQFWENAEYRIKEITHKIEKDLTASLKGRLADFEMGAGGAAKLSDEERMEVVQRGKTIINSIQMRELTDVLTFLNEDVFSDDKHKFYICIDRLDENWVDESFRYLLIRSLIETLRDFLQVRNVKIIAVLRTDLIERVFRFTRDPGFQEEKYRSLYLPLRWTEEQLLELLDKRVGQLVRETYTKKPVRCAELLPGKVDKNLSGSSYLISRTLMRPRDLIEFFNNVIENATGKANVTKEMVLEGEGIYSKNRMRSLQDEWISDYPSLIDCSALIKKMPNIFRLSSFSRDEVEEFCLGLSVSVKNVDLLAVQARAVVDGLITWENFLCSTMHVFYVTGIVGLKTDTFEAYQWSHQGSSAIVADTITLDTSVTVHPMFYRVLGVKPA